MKIFVHNKDIVDVTEADTIVLPVDGSAPGLEGNIARRFMQRVGVEEMHQLYAPPPYYPFNGDSYWSNVEGFEGTHFTHICCVGTLSHAPGADHRSYTRSAFRNMLEMAGGDLGSKLACPVLTGGARVDFVDAVYLMLSEVDTWKDPQAPSYLELHIAEKDKERFEKLRDIVPG